MVSILFCQFLWLNLDNDQGDVVFGFLSPGKLIQFLINGIYNIARSGPGVVSRPQNGAQAACATGRSTSESALS